MKNWTRDNIPANLSNNTDIITGTSSGIGMVIAYELAKRGAKVIASNRNVEKARNAMKTIQNKSDDLSGFSFLPFEDSSLKSVRASTKRINSDSSISHINGLLLNAGITALPERKESVDGFELQMATNVLGHHWIQGQS